MYKNRAPSRYTIALAAIAPVAALALGACGSSEPQEREVPCAGDAVTDDNRAVGHLGEYEFAFVAPGEQETRAVIGNLSVRFAERASATNVAAPQTSEPELSWQWHFSTDTPVSLTEGNQKANLLFNGASYVMGIRSYTADTGHLFAVACLNPDSNGMSKGL